MLPVHILIEGTLKTLSERGVFYTIIQRGEKHNGVILLKLWGRGDTCKLLIQQRSFDGDLEWINALDTETVPERDADTFIKDQTAYDPDLWVIEIEDEALVNPFV